MAAHLSRTMMGFTPTPENVRVTDLEKVVRLLVEGLRAMPGLTPVTRGYIDQAAEILHPAAAAPKATAGAAPKQA
jgi:hypothetical protein